MKKGKNLILKVSKKKRLENYAQENDLLDDKER